MNQAEIEANVTLEQALRRANLLAAAAEVSQNVTQIMDIDELLPKTVDIICDAYNFYYAGVFLIDEAREFAVLRAGRGKPGQIMMENNHKLAVGGNSMIGACTARNEARISLDVDTEKVWYPNPVLPETRSEMALPLAVGGHVIGAVTVQSTEAAAFSDEDISSLQAMANQLAIAIENAHQRQELEEAHAELLQAKMHEAIATATGDAIHWIGNKADPIRSSVDRTRTDLQLLTVLMGKLLNNELDGNSSVAQLIQKEAAVIQQDYPQISEAADKLSQFSSEKLERRLSLSSTLEDLQIIEDAAAMILRIKEELIGPAREQAPRPTMIDDVVKDAITAMNLPAGLVTLAPTAPVPLVVADPVQMHRVFTNLIKNAVEAAGDERPPEINLLIRSVEDSAFVAIDVVDNGIGIAPDDLDNIWITFHTSKGIRGHAGFGLPASRLIVEQTGGSISAVSQLGQGSTFTVKLPVYKGRGSNGHKVEHGRGKILLIDDNDHWRHFATVTLKNAGYKIESPDRGYTISNAHRFDLVLVDDILAGADSLAILHILKDSGAINKTLMLSSNPRVERTKERMLAGIKNLIAKPYTPNSLLSEVARAIR
ncbi:MAG: GAF domain-containing protein [Anaerolineae bacterium]|nr:GAF domain-containing protein [Anaerolineae bacterium]